MLRRSLSPCVSLRYLLSWEGPMIRQFSNLWPSKEETILPRNKEAEKIDYSLFNKDFKLVFDHPKFFIINKASGVGIQDDSRRMGDDRWKEGIATKLMKLDSSVKSVQRLDKSVTGGTVFAKDLRTAQMISRNLRVGGEAGYKITRRYVGIIKAGELTTNSEYVTFWNKERTAGTITTTLHGCLESTRFMTAGFECEGYQLVVLQLLTGKKHQIRRHLADVLKKPLLNDILFGQRYVREPNSAIGLHSSYVELKIGLSSFIFVIPVEFSQGVWKGFVDRDGNFDEVVTELLQRFDGNFKDRVDQEMLDAFEQKERMILAAVRDQKKVLQLVSSSDDLAPKKEKKLNKRERKELKKKKGSGRKLGDKSRAPGSWY